MRALMALIGYVSTATVLSLAIGLGYLMQSGGLDDEKIFRIVALIHDVDIDAMEGEQIEQESGTPEEEPSLSDIAVYKAEFARNFEVKQDALRRGSDAFNHSFRKLKSATDEFSELAAKIESELKNQGELSSKKAVAQVVRNLEMMGLEQAKEELMLTLEEPDGLNDVILLMNAMSTGKLKKILQKFRSKDELAALHAIHKLMLNGGPKAASMEKALRDLETLKAQRP